jgi:predicted phage-related endonuclease
MPTVEIIISIEQKENAEQQIISKIEQMKELEAIIKEAEAEVEALKDELKTEMMRRNAEEMSVGKYIVRWTEVLSNRFDSTAFKKVMPDVYKAYTKQTASRRFSISG